MFVACAAVTVLVPLRFGGRHVEAGSITRQMASARPLPSHSLHHGPVSLSLSRSSHHITYAPQHHTPALTKP